MEKRCAWCVCGTETGGGGRNARGRERERRQRRSTTTALISLFTAPHTTPLDHTRTATRRTERALGGRKEPNMQTHEFEHEHTHGHGRQLMLTTTTATAASSTPVSPRTKPPSFPPQLIAAAGWRCALQVPASVRWAQASTTAHDIPAAPAAAPSWPGNEPLRRRRGRSRMCPPCARWAWRASSQRQRIA